MPLDLDDDDTTPTGNTGVLGEVAATLAAFPLGVVAWGAATSPGVRRRVNEDSWGRRGDVFVVADGMGGRGGGALAARTAVDRFLDRLVPTTDRPDWRGIVAQVNTEVVRAAADRGIDRVGTTLLAAAVGGPLVTLVHLGDSRAYRLSRVSRARIAGKLLTSPPSSPPPLRSGARPPHASDEVTDDRLDLLTHDHNVRAELLAAGLDVADYRDRGVALHGLTSFIGLEHDVLRVDVLAVAVRSGDRILLCTDGIHRQLDDDHVRAVLAARSPRQAAEALVHDADEAGGRDNATAVVVEIGAVDAEAR
jgi:serine/threonine protein phosphatase PrpC